MDTREDERSLVDSLAGDDQAAFWELWEKHSSHLRHLCTGLLGNHTDDVEDVLSETMLKAWDGLSRRSAEVHNLRAWLTRIAYHVCMDWWRSRGRVVCSSDVFGDAAPQVLAHQQLPDDPQDLVLQREEYGRIVRMVGSLPPHLRDPLALYAFRDESYAEIASQLSISEASLRKRIQQARTLIGQAEPRPTLPLSPGGPAFADGSLSLSESTPAAAERMAREALSRTPYEIGWRNVVVRVVHVALPTGAVRDYPIVLDHEPARRAVRRATIHEYLERHPRGWKRRLELAQIHYASGEWQEAVEQYRRVLAAQPKLLDGWLRLGEMLRLSQNFAEARQAYESGLRQARLPATQRYFQGHIALCDQDYLRAAQEFQAAAEHEPQNPVHWHAVARAHQGGGRLCEALDAYERVLALNPDDLVALLNSCEVLLAQARVADAQPRLDKALDLQPDCAVGLTLLATTRCAAGLVRGREGQQTRRILTRLLHAAPESADAHAVMAHFHFRRGEADAGRALLRDYTTRHPQCPQGWYHYSACLGAAGDYHPAADAILLAHALHPRSFPVARWACAALTLAGRLEDLRTMVERLLIDFGERWDTYTTAGFALAAGLWEHARACELSAVATERQPNLASAWLQHGEVLTLANRVLDALQALQHAWELLPPGAGADAAAQVACRLARCHHLAGNNDAAHYWFVEAARCARERPVVDRAAVSAWLGQALEALGDRRGASAAYRASLTHGIPYPLRQEVLDGLHRLQQPSTPRRPRNAHPGTPQPGATRAPGSPWGH